MEKRLVEIFNKTLKAATVVLTISLLWFSFVYYPKAVNRLKSESAAGRGLIGNVQASSLGFPFENSRFRIEYVSWSNFYLVTIHAKTADQFSQYKTESQLTLKNILSVDSLCGLNVAYSTNLPFVRQANDLPGGC